MKIPFSKMQGLGNDFVVFDGVRRQIELSRERARWIADRHFGVGCDQILVVERAVSAEADFRYRIWNADGGEVEQCGNGARCFARFVRDQGLTSKNEIRVETKSGLITPRIEPGGDVTVDMGAPVFEPARIPFVGDSADVTQELVVGGSVVRVSVLSMGNPHAVQAVDDIERAPVSSQGPLIENHARFPQRANAGYMQVLGRDRIALRVWERGAGETLACGTGACAAVVAGIGRGLLDSRVRVVMRGGELVIAWAGHWVGRRASAGIAAAAGEGKRASDALNSQIDCSVLMTGPAVTVFHGEMEFDEL